jgi:hypothetical protein
LPSEREVGKQREHFSAIANGPGHAAGLLPVQEIIALQLQPPHKNDTRSIGNISKPTTK